jgi:hypothetical protein
MLALAVTVLAQGAYPMTIQHEAGRPWFDAVLK